MLQLLCSYNDSTISRSPPDFLLAQDLTLLMCRERQRQKFDNLQNKKGEYADTVEKLQQVMLDNRRLEEEKRKLEDAWNELQYTLTMTATTAAAA